MGAYTSIHLVGIITDNLFYFCGNGGVGFSIANGEIDIH